MPTIITTPRPPLNIFGRAVRTVDDTEGWVSLYETPIYRIPSTDFAPEKDVEAVAILTSLVISPNFDTVTWDGPLFVSVRRAVPDGSGGFVHYWIGKDMEVPPDDFGVFELGKQNVPSNDIVQVRVLDGGAVSATMQADFQLSFVLNQREQYEVIT